MWSRSDNTAPQIHILPSWYAIHSVLHLLLANHSATGKVRTPNPKMRYKRTDRKEFVKQLAQIEHHQAHIRQMHLQRSTNQPSDKECTVRPEHHHTIGKTENFPEHLNLFVQRHSGDPAIEVCVTVPAFPFGDL